MESSRKSCLKPEEEVDIKHKVTGQTDGRTDKLK